MVCYNVRDILVKLVKKVFPVVRYKCFPTTVLNKLSFIKIQ